MLRAFRAAALARSASSKNLRLAWSPTGRLEDRTRGTAGLIEFVVSAKRIGLENSSVSDQVALRMLAAAVSGIIEHRRWWCRAAEGTVITDIDPGAGNIGFALGQHWHGGVVAMDTLAGEYMRKHSAWAAGGVR